MRTRRILTAIGVAAALLVGPATMANAYEADGYTVKVSVRATAPGKMITVTIKVPANVKNVRVRIICPTLGTTEIIVGGVKEVTMPVGPNGEVAVNFSAKRSCNCYIEVFDADTGKQVGGRIPVQFVLDAKNGAADAAGAAGDAGSLAQTGSDALVPMAIGAGVLVAGGATAVAVGRKRRRA